MKKTIITVCLLGFLGVAAMAQAPVKTAATHTEAAAKPKHAKATARPKHVKAHKAKKKMHVKHQAKAAKASPAKAG